MVDRVMAAHEQTSLKAREKTRFKKSGLSERVKETILPKERKN